MQQKSVCPNFLSGGLAISSKAPAGVSPLSPEQLKSEAGLHTPFVDWGTSCLQTVVLSVYLSVFPSSFSAGPVSGYFPLWKSKAFPLLGFLDQAALKLFTRPLQHSQIASLMPLPLLANVPWMSRLGRNKPGRAAHQHRT